MPWLTHLLALINDLVTDRSRLALENIALRQQIVVLKRSVKRAKIQDCDRIFWILMRRLLASWRDTLLIVKPEAVIKWHRKGFGYYWHRKSQRGKPGRPPIDPEIIELIKRISKDNVTWGAPRIQSELTLLGHEIAESTVAKYMVRHPKKPSQTWRTFLANHMSVAAACDFFVVPTLTFKPLYCFVVLSHDRRKIVHFNVTQHPTDEWTAQQIIEAFPGDGSEPRFLHRDLDSFYGRKFRKKLTAMGIEEVISARKSPWQNPYAERVIGSIRRECTDHIIALGERHLLRTLLKYQAYYNEARCHMSTATRPSLVRSSTFSAQSSPPHTLADSTTVTVALRRSNQPHLKDVDLILESRPWSTLYPQSDSFCYHVLNAGRAGSDRLALGFREGQQVIGNAPPESPACQVRARP